MVNQDVKYSKKLILPLIIKYSISIQTNYMFWSVLRMFEGNPYYQVWGINIVFGKVTTYQKFERAARWILDPENAKYLSRMEIGNVQVANLGKNDFFKLEKDIKGIEDINSFKEIAKTFDNKQYMLIDKEFHLDSMNGSERFTNKEFDKWKRLFDRFSQLPEDRRKGLIERVSQTDNLNSLYTLISAGVKPKYTWDADSFIDFVDKHTKSIVCYNKDNVVVIRARNFKDAKSLCAGKTNWPIIASVQYWNENVRDINASQYFIFNFNAPETAENSITALTIEENGFFSMCYSLTSENIMNSNKGGMSEMRKHFETIGIQPEDFTDVGKQS